MKLFHKKLDSKGFATHIIVPALAIVAIGGIGAYILGQSHATTAVGSWWTNKTNPQQGCTIQGHYVNRSVSNGGTQTRADGYNVSVSNGYIIQVAVSQGTNSTGQHVNAGQRILNFTNQKSSSTLTGISTSYLPWLDGARGADMTVQVTLRNNSGDYYCMNTFKMG